ncbi:MAG: phosphatidylglycerol lysyltransferase domain-containing protein [Parachlamydiales bacterium]|jgi:lysylphosphatidylglycerol synthetase-like protein (DUF2156 family)
MNVINEEEKELFIRYGSTASEAMLDFPCQLFRIPHCIGIIAYRVENNCAIVFGEPVCPPEELSQLTEAFHKYCQASNLNVIYIVVSEKFAKWAASHHCNIMIEACSELIFDPNIDPCIENNRVRYRMKKAMQQGLTVHEYIPFDPVIENALKEIGTKWQHAKKDPQIYIGHFNFFENYAGKRWFYVKEGENITSMIMLSRIEASNGWLLKFLITSPHAYKYTSEFLMTSVLKTLKEENCSFLTKGMVPADALGQVSGLGTFSGWLARGIYNTIFWTFQFAKRKEYWQKYHPKEIPAFLLFSNPSIGLNEIRALRKVFKTNSCETP